MGLVFGSNIGETFFTKERTLRQTKQVSYADPKSDDEGTFPKVEKVEFPEHGVVTCTQEPVSNAPPFNPDDTHRMPMRLFEETNAKLDFSKLFSSDNIKATTEEY